jgi:hypothetical protein
VSNACFPHDGGQDSARVARTELTDLSNTNDSNGPMPAITTSPAGFRIILDDGVFFVDLSCERAEAVAPGFLMVRVQAPPGALACYECLGAFQEAADGTWGAST